MPPIKFEIHFFHCMWSLSDKWLCEGKFSESLHRYKMIIYALTRPEQWKPNFCHSASTTCVLPIGIAPFSAWCMVGTSPGVGQLLFSGSLVDAHTSLPFSCLVYISPGTQKGKYALKKTVHYIGRTVILVTLWYIVGVGSGFLMPTVNNLSLPHPWQTPTTVPAFCLVQHLHFSHSARSETLLTSRVIQCRCINNNKAFYFLEPWGFTQK